MNLPDAKSIFTGVLCVAWATLFTSLATAQRAELAEPSSDVLSDSEWQRVDDAVERSLKWLANQQQRDGSFPTSPLGQPGVTSLCVMAFMANGHLPGDGPYGDQLSKAVGYISSCQKRNGLISLTAPNRPDLSRGVQHDVGVSASYNHAISALALGECYSTGRGIDSKELDKVITQAIETTLEIQQFRKRRKEDLGGWRYLNVTSDSMERYDSDLSVTGWFLMSLRSAKNAGFDVPQSKIDDAVAYVRRCYHKEYGTYQIMATRHERLSRGMGGAGILALAHAGEHDDPEVRKAGDWILKYDFQVYNHNEDFDTAGWVDDRYHYSVFQCSQAMYQLGGRYWAEYFPPVVDVLLENQQADGSWSPESHFYDTRYGNAYTTSLVLLALGAPNQLLPIFQR